MPWLRHRALSIFIIALVKPTAAAFVTSLDASSHARAGAFELVAGTFLEQASGAGWELRKGTGAACDKSPSRCQVDARAGREPGRQGAAGMERPVADLEPAGGRVLGREVTIEAGGVRTRPNLFVALPSGQQAFLEIKTLTVHQQLSVVRVSIGGDQWQE